MMMVLFGPPGAGKGTQADLLSQKYNFVKFSMGDILREEMALKSSMGTQLKKYVNRGMLAPDEIVLRLVENFLLKHQDSDILFDGFPRNVNQARNLHKIVNRFGLSLDIALEMHLSEKELMQRLVNRMYCPNCGRIYNAATNPPKVEGICDACGYTLEKRRDDDENIIKKRLEVYAEETRNLTHFYQSQNIYNRVNANQSQAEVLKKISKIVDAHIDKK